MAKISEACRCNGKFEAEYPDDHESQSIAAEARHKAWLERHQNCGIENEPRMRSGGYANTSMGPISGEVPSAAWTRTPAILGFRPNEER